MSSQRRRACLAPQCAKIAAAAYARYTNDNRRRDQRNDDHLQCIEEQGTDVIEHRDEFNAEYSRLTAGRFFDIEHPYSGDKRQNDRD